jgi:hypothetical protein
MATAMVATDLGEEQDSYEPEETAAWEVASQPSSRLLRSQRQELWAEIEHARSIPGTHDQEGFYSEETLDRAVAFLEMHIDRLWRSYGVRAPIPTIGPGPAGSVDLFWEWASWKLLVNIPAAPDTLATFYADDRGRQRTKGSFDSNEFSPGIAACLTR